MDTSRCSAYTGIITAVCKIPRYTGIPRIGLIRRSFFAIPWSDYQGHIVAVKIFLFRPCVLWFINHACPGVKAYTNVKLWFSQVKTLSLYMLEAVLSPRIRGQLSTKNKHKCIQKYCYFIIISNIVWSLILSLLLIFEKMKTYKRLHDVAVTPDFVLCFVKHYCGRKPVEQPVPHSCWRRRHRRYWLQLCSAWWTFTWPTNRTFLLLLHWSEA